jgi:hypothetical protein
MKALSKTSTVVDGNKVTITGELVDVAFPAIVAQRHNTIRHHVSGHPSKPRHLQSNSHGFLVTRKGSDGILFPNDELVAIGVEIDSKLTDVPVFVEPPTNGNLFGRVVSEIPFTSKLQESDDGKAWSDVQGADSNFAGDAGKFYRCISTNKNGDATSNPVKIPKLVVK